MGWMKFFGVLKEYSTELDRIDKAIESEFERVDPGMWIGRAERR